MNGEQTEFNFSGNRIACVGFRSPASIGNDGGKLNSSLVNPLAASMRTDIVSRQVEINKPPSNHQLLLEVRDVFLISKPDLDVTEQSTAVATGS